MSYVPTFQLFSSDGVTLVYTFTIVQNIKDFQDPYKFSVHDSLRGQGEIIVPGSAEAWDMPLSFKLQGTDYSDLVSKIATLKSAIPVFTKFILKVGLTSSTTENYYVMRIQPMDFPIATNNKRVDWQDVTINFRVNSWA